MKSRVVLTAGLLFAAACSSPSPDSTATSSSASGAPTPATDPDRDADLDGVPDLWEDGRVTVTLPSGKTRELDLKGMGGSSRHKDIYVWLSWMEGEKDRCPGHQPAPTAFPRVKSAFADAPVAANADGQKGIRLHVIPATSGVRHQEFLGTTNANGDYVWQEYDNIRNAEFPVSLTGRFHYGLLAHRLGNIATTSGTARTIPGKEFVVSLGDDQSDPDYLQGTFMHELGHTMGLAVS